MEKTTNEKIIEAMKLALEMTTPEKSGNPWDNPKHKTGNLPESESEWL